jgi:hypothetical protein
MAKRDIVDHKARTGIPGSGLGKVVNEAAWGELTATQRYGGSARTFDSPPDYSKPQDCGDSWGTNKQGPRSLIDPNDWRRGGGGGETRPGYRPGFKGAPHGDSHRDSSVEDQSGPKLRESTPRYGPSNRGGSR